MTRSSTAENQPQAGTRQPDSTDENPPLDDRKMTEMRVSLRFSLWTPNDTSAHSAVVDLSKFLDLRCDMPPDEVASQCPEPIPYIDPIIDRITSSRSTYGILLAMDAIDNKKNGKLAPISTEIHHLWTKATCHIVFDCHPVGSATSRGTILQHASRNASRPVRVALDSVWTAGACSSTCASSAATR